MTEAGQRKTMTFLSRFSIEFFLFTMSTEIVIERERQKDFDKIIWNGDCSKINGDSFVSDEERICTCQKRIKMNDITTKIFGTIYPDDNEFVNQVRMKFKSTKYFQDSRQNSLWDLQIFYLGLIKR